MTGNNENEKRKIKVAWYENNMQFMESILYYLDKEKVFEVKVFGDPASAKEEIKEYQPHLVIFDFRMPNINGVEMYKQLKGKLDFVPVFFSIWARDDSTRSDIINAGIESEAIFDKNIEPDSFPGALRKYYEHHKRKKATK
ncbi:MAG: response regulator [Candidatus Aminicenantes bacterium]|jgi:DNA-binding response OmpR family regulator